MDITSYRLVQEKYSSSAFDGEGSRLYGGRWNSKGVAVIYTSDSLALSCLELLVHLPSYKLLQKYSYIPVSFSASLVEEGDLVEGWNRRPVSRVSQAIGDRWVESNSSQVLKVPSVIIPEGANYLFNVNHPHFSRISIGQPRSMAFDPRLQSR